jgi:aminoglycoside phosphotransferase family enzyme/predicted kinase
MTESQSEAIAFLSQPLSYGRSAGEQVERIETHASIVFLIGQLALKLKRNVRFAYLDYSTVELRRRFCETELRLNRRTAPDLYRRVRAITREADGTLTFDGKGEVLDWVIEMRRFDQASLFSSLAETRKLTRRLLEELVDHIIAFHRAAEPVVDFGGAAGVDEVVAINDRSLREAGLADREADELLRLTRRALERCRVMLDRRRTAGRVRRCHGDLHLGNICLYDGRPVLFDGIEFSESLACIDTLYDLAFLVMDLCHRRLAGDANLIFNRYLDMSEEGDGVAALPLFLSLRAAVRAHVVAAAASAAPKSSRTEMFEKARSYLQFALELLRPDRPLLIAIGGLSGSGKSTLAAAIAPQLGARPGARVLRSDVIRKRRIGKALSERLPPDCYTEEANVAVYAEMRAGAREALAAGYSVVLDAVAAQASERDGFEELARSCEVPFLGIWLQAPADVLGRRLLERTGDASDATPAILRQQLEYELGPMRWAIVDAAGGIEETLHHVTAVVTR